MNQTYGKIDKIRVKKLSDRNDVDLKNTTPEERWAIMWQLAQDAWAFKGESIAEPELQRHIIRIFRRTR